VSHSPSCPGRASHHGGDSRLRTLLKRSLVCWFAGNTLAAGLLALAWLLLRSGSKLSRLAYPCQQAAFTTASLAFGAPVVWAIVGARRLITARLRTLPGIIVAALGLLSTLGLWAYLSQTAAYQGPTLQPNSDYRAQLFHQTGCPHDPLGDRFVCLDDLIEMMGGHGLKFYQSTTASLTAGPAGIVAADDVVVVKINYQWPQRGGTNVDLLRGLVHRIVNHPDGFTGEVVVCENAQFQSVQNFDRPANNAEDTTLSPHDVVVHFQSVGHRVSHYDWGAIRTTAVGEYSLGDTADGYVVYPYDAALTGRVSYPKFRTSYGTQISLRHGSWDPVAGYDREHLKLINLPVLKSHHAVYGATALVKNYMGVVTNSLGTNSHNAVRYGILGALIGEIRPADLNILDAIWINADPFDGPGTTYQVATRADQLIASVDPVAADLWAVKNVLVPAFIANGYSPPWPYPSADPDDPGSSFRQYLDRSMSYLLAAGFDSTNDLGLVDAIDLGPPGEASDPTGAGAPFRIAKHPGGYQLTWSAPERGEPAEEYVLYRTPLPGDPAAAVPECEAALGTVETAIVPALPDGFGFLVVGRNVIGDGSFGRDSRGRERPGPAEVDVCP
jgi:hypothetical protein